jgi:uncharacterized delta-60 repeat protein
MIAREANWGRSRRRFRLVGLLALIAAATLGLDDSTGRAGACPCIRYLPGLVVGGATLGTDLRAGVATVDASGRLVDAGFAVGHGATRLAVVRYRTDGRLDPSFGHGGVSLVPAHVDVLGAVAVDGTGRVVVGGYARVANGSAFAVTRLEPDGSLDTSFGTDGTATAQVDANDAVLALEPLPDGGLVVAGSAQRSDQQMVIAMLRFGAGGRLDPAFGNGGVAVAPLARQPADLSARALDAAFDASGRIVFGGQVPLPTPAGQNAREGPFVARYLADGTPDPSFGNGGTVIGKSVADAAGVSVLPDGSILTSGQWPGPAGTAELTRYRTDGTLDSGFGANGSVSLGSLPDGNDQPLLATAPDGSIDLVVGAVVQNGVATDALLRLRADGSRDPDFGVRGEVLMPRAARLLSLADGTPVTIEWDGSRLDRFQRDGSRDPAFFEVPRTETTGANALSLEPDGRVVTAGWTESGGRRVFELARFLRTNGTLDPTFGTGGFADTALAQGDAEATALVRLADGRLLAAGEAGGRAVLLRYLSSGVLDLTFGTDGVALGPPGPARALGVQADGAILVAGGGFSVTRYSADGRVDPSFGSSGTSTPIGPDAAADALVVQPDGRILVAGSRAGAFAVVRLLANGSTDPTFAVVTGPPGAASAIALQPDGRVLTTGTGFAVTRSNADGTPDRTFGVGGVATPPVRNGDAAAIAVQSNGKIVLGGSGFTIARVDSFGYIDETYGSNYPNTHGVESSRPDGEITALALVNGTIVAAGTVPTNGTTSTAVNWYIEEGELAQADGPPLVAVQSGRVHGITNAGVSSPALSPDRKSIAYVSTSSGRPEVYVVPVAGGSPLELTSSPFGTDSVALGHVAWSPDGKTIAFDTTGHVSDPRCTRACLTSDVFAVASDGTHLRELVSGGSGASWSHEGKYLAYNGPIASDGTVSIVVAAADGSSPRTIARGSSPAWAPSVPLWSPRGDLLAYQITPDSRQGFVVRRAGGALVRTFYDDASPAWAPDGRRLAAFVNYASVLVVLPLAGGKGRIVMGGYALRDPSWSPDGTRVALFGTWRNRSTLIIRDTRTGHLLRRVPGLRATTPPSWSADGSTIYLGG